MGSRKAALLLLFLGFLDACVMEFLALLALQALFICLLVAFDRFGTPGFSVPHHGRGPFRRWGGGRRGRIRLGGGRGRGGLGENRGGEKQERRTDRGAHAGGDRHEMYLGLEWAGTVAP